MLSRLGLPSTTVWSPVKSPAARILSRVTHQFPTRIQELTIIPTGEVRTTLTSVTVSHFQRKWPGGRGRLETAAPLFAVRRHVQGGQEVEQLWRRRRCWGNWHCYSSTESTASKVSGVKNVPKGLELMLWFQSKHRSTYTYQVNGSCQCLQVSFSIDHMQHPPNQCVSASVSLRTTRAQAQDRLASC